MRPSPPSTSLPSQPSKKDGRSFRIGPRSVGRRASLLLGFDTAAGSDEPWGVGGPSLAPERGTGRRVLAAGAKSLGGSVKLPGRWGRTGAKWFWFVCRWRLGHVVNDIPTALPGPAGDKAFAGRLVGAGAKSPSPCPRICVDTWQLQNKRKKYMGLAINGWACPSPFMPWSCSLGCCSLSLVSRFLLLSRPAWCVFGGNVVR